jgi:hypothetical protein
MSGTPWECRIVWPGETGEEVLSAELEIKGGGVSES